MNTSVGCTDDPRVRLDVLLQTDHRPGIDFVEVRTRLLERDVEERSETTDVRTVSSFLAPRDTTRFEGLPPAVAREVVVELVRGDGSVLQSGQTTARSQRTNQVLITVCLQCRCPEGDPSCQVCPPGQRCDCGQELCVPDTCAEGDDSCAPGCRSDEECRASELECVDAVCREGACLRAPVDALCRAFEVCDIDDGCVPDPRIECTVADDCPPPRGDCAERVCEGGRCGEALVPEACGPSELCVDGRCAAMCTDDEDCVAADACSTARCTDGTCASVDACGALGCDPELGCVPRAVRVDVEDGTSAEGGATSSVLVRLTARPTEPVRVLVFASDRSEARPEGATLTELVFDADTWRTPQRVTFVGEDDEVVDGDRAYEAVALASSVEATWEGLRASASGLENLDDEVAATGVLEVRLGIDVGCARTATEVWCWGDNRDGLLGVDPSVLSGSEVPRRIDLGGRARTKLSLSARHACVIDSTGELLCWGSSSEGQLGNGTTTSRSSPGLVTGIPPVADVSAGDARTCAITVDERLFCWGGSTFEPLGDGTSGPFPTPREIRAVPAGSTLARGEPFIPAGFVLPPGAAPLGWGTNGSGQLATGSFATESVPTATRFPPATEMVSSGSVACALLATDRRMVCAGNGSQFGTGAPIFALSPVSTTETTFRSVSIVAGVAEDGLLWRWGLDWYARNGLPIASRPSRDPSAPTGLATTTSDGFRVCVSNDGGRAWCDGYFPTNERGAPREALGPVTQIWSGFDDVLARPTDPTLPLVGVDDVPSSALTVDTSGPAPSSDDGQHTCYVTSTNELWCLGDDNDGQLGRGSRSATPQPPARVPLEGRILHVTVGQRRVGSAGAFSCASSETRTWWWGRMTFDGLDPMGMPTAIEEQTTSPVVLTELDGRRVVDLEAGGGHVCAVVDTGALYCWGRGDSGQLGVPVGSGFGPHLVPLTDVVDVDLGDTHTCALTADGDVHCFGANRNQEFERITVLSSVEPVRIALPAAAEEVVVGVHAACARLVGGEVWCWGGGAPGAAQLGDSEQYVPRRVPALAGAQSLASTAQMTDARFCGRFADGALRCVGGPADRLAPWTPMPAP